MGSARVEPGAALAAGHHLGGGRQRAGAGADPRERATAGDRRPPCRAAGAGAGRRPVLGDLVQPADPGGQGGPARAAPAVAATAEPRAQAHLVVQRHLGADSLHSWLAARLAESAEVERAGSAKGYRVLRITARTSG